MTSEHEAALRDRLRSKETVFLGFSVKKVAQKFSLLTAAVLSGDKAAAQAASEAALREVRLYGLEVNKAELVAKACEEQLSYSAEIEKSIRERVVSTEASIDALAQELAHAKEVRQHKEEYEALAKVVNKHSAKAKTRQEQEVVEGRLTELQREHDQLRDEVDLRNRQFTLLLQTIHDLHLTIGEDDQAEAEERAELAAEQDADEDGAALKRRRGADEEEEDQDQEEEEEEEGGPRKRIKAT